MSSAAGGSGVGAGGGAAGGKPPAELWESVKEKGTEIGSGVLKRAQSIKVPPELEPTLASARQSAVETFAKLPGPVQQAMPFVTIGATVAIGMKMWGDRALFAEKVKCMQLETELKAITEERDLLKLIQERVTEECLTLVPLPNEPQAKISLPRTDQELKMSKAIADATQAAAAASQAAALAAQACIARPLQQKPSELAGKRP